MTKVRSGVSHVAELLAGARTLAALDLGGNQLGPHGVREIVQRCLQHVCIPSIGG